MTSDPIFDLRKSVSRRNLERLIIIPIVVAGFIWLGFRLIPDDAVWALSFEAVETWNLWGFLGLFLIVTGVVNLLKLMVFVWRARGTSGEWRFRLTQDDLLWKVPVHAHGPEEGFHVPLSAIKSLERRRIARDDDPDMVEYWAHFQDRPSIQLREYTGYSISSLMEQVHQAGVPYENTTVDG